MLVFTGSGIVLLWFYLDICRIVFGGTRGGGVSDSVSSCLSVMTCGWKGVPTFYESGR